MIDKKSLSETDICAKYITPAVIGQGWTEQGLRREVSFTKGRIIVRGQLVTRGQAKRADYVLYHQHIPIALIEAKDNTHAVGDGMQQALDYAQTLEIPFVFSSNGDGFLFHDRTGLSAVLETTLGLNGFPSPEALWAQYRIWKGLIPTEEDLILQPYYDDGSGKEPRYYQRAAINATIEAIAKGQNRVLLVMATGTGKTYTAFQIIWRLWRSGRKKRILFLADRNVLIDQTMVNDFRPFGAAMAKLSVNSKTIERDDGTHTELPTAMDNKRRIDTSFEIYLGLYQAITGVEEKQKIYKELSSHFFDLIIIDECHRGSAAEDSAWREILEYFSSATQIGLTATPKETSYVSNMDYFGQPAYTYSLRQGIDDGFLAPYKVIKVHLSVDIEGYRPKRGETDSFGNTIEDRQYNQKDFDRNIIIDDRTKRVAKWLSDYLKQGGNRYQKTMIFCVDTEHAARMRQALINENQDLVQKNPKYAMRITGDDPEGAAQLGNFIDPESTYPVLVTTSRLLSTGVDAQTCRLIVLDREVGSMTEFKQILGRGTRVHEETKKYFFTVVDFRKATNHFADKEFDGDPVQIYEPNETDPPVPPDTDSETPPSFDETIVQRPNIDLPLENPEFKGKYLIKGKSVRVILERIEHLDEHGKLITESLRDYSRKTIRKRYASLEQFLQRWQTSERKDAIFSELAEEGLLLEPLQEEVGKNLDPFDLICHIAFDQPPLTRQQRAANVRKQNVFDKYGIQAKAVLEALLNKYQDEGIVAGLENVSILGIPPFNQMGTPLQLIKEFGTKSAFENAVHELQRAIYADVA